MRLKIWGMALPVQDGLPRVIHMQTWVSISEDREIGIGLQLTSDPNSSFMDTESKYHGTHVKSHLGMLGARRECREVFETAFPNTLELKDEENKRRVGILHYHDNTTICIVSPLLKITYII